MSRYFYKRDHRLDIVGARFLSRSDVGASRWLATSGSPEQLGWQGAEPESEPWAKPAAPMEVNANIRFRQPVRAMPRAVQHAG